MKKNLLFCLLALFCAMNLFTACSDSDDGNISQIIDSDIAGKYKGMLDVALVNGGESEPIVTGAAQIIEITKVDDRTVSLTLKDFSFGTLNLGTITLDKCVLASNDNDTYRFTGSQDLTLQDPIGKCAATFDVTYAGKAVTVNLNIDVPALGQTVQVTYKGSKMTGNESNDTSIKSFVFNREVALADSLVTDVAIDGNNISITVADTIKPEYLKLLAPTIELTSDKATVSPATDTPQDFNTPVTYTVTAEDGTTAKYTVTVIGNKYDFETWVAGVEDQKPEMTYYEPSGWSSSNAGAQLLKGFGFASSYVVTQEENAHSGKYAVKIQTIDSKGGDMVIAKIPKVTTGSLFLGIFKPDMTNTLNSTKFGIPYYRKPKALKGWYQYTPGETYYTVKEKPYKDHCHEAVADAAKTDEFAISVVLYETDGYDTNNWSDCLTGTDDAENNIYTSSRIAAIGQLFGGKQADWKSFELLLEWKKNYDASKKYRMTISCSSSKDGDKFWGAPGSTLIVDDFELVTE